MYCTDTYLKPEGKLFQRNPQSYTFYKFITRFILSGKIYKIKTSNEYILLNN